MKRFLFRFINFLYKWLPIVFGCHCRADRSFHYRGIPFPICARCTGMLGGILTALSTIWFFRPATLVWAAMLIPQLVDGVIQQATAYESNNRRRLVTGLLFGYGVTGLLLLSLVAVFQWGFQMGLHIKGS